MARAPRARVSKTSGQGVSRLSYQKGRQLGNKGTGTPGDAPSTKFDTGGIKGPGTTGGNRTYGKSEGGADINVSYGATITPSDIEQVKELGKLAMPKTKALGPTKAKMLK